MFWYVNLVIQQTIFACCVQTAQTLVDARICAYPDKAAQVNFECMKYASVLSDHSLPCAWHSRVKISILHNHVHQAKIFISLRICAAWSMFSSYAWQIKLSPQVHVYMKHYMSAAFVFVPCLFEEEGYCFWLSVVRCMWYVVRGSGFLLGTLSPQLLPQFLPDSFETLQGPLRWSEDMHVFFFRILKLFFITFFRFLT